MAVIPDRASEGEDRAPPEGRAADVPPTGAAAFPSPPGGAGQAPPPSPSGGLWWVAAAGEQPHGPRELGELAAMYREGRLSPAVLLCKAEESGWLDGPPAWLPVAAILGPPMVPPTDADAVPRSAGRTAWRPRSLAAPILATIFCCVIGGVIAIVYTAQANAKGAVGDLPGAERDAKTAQTWLVVSLITPVAIIVTYFAVAILIGVVVAATRGGRG